MRPAGGGAGECGQRPAGRRADGKGPGRYPRRPPGAPLAQWTEQVPSKHLAGGSNPSRGTRPLRLQRQHLAAQHGEAVMLGGLDISKHAIRMAAKLDSRGLYAVAGIYGMPPR